MGWALAWFTAGNQNVSTSVGPARGGPAVASELKMHIQVTGCKVRQNQSNIGPSWVLNTLSRNVQVLSDISLFVDQESQFLALTFFLPYLGLDCNHHTQYLLAILCVLVYIFLKNWPDPFCICGTTFRVNLQGTFVLLKVDFIPNLLLSCSECSDVIYTTSPLEGLLGLQLEETVPLC